MLIPEQHQ
jgi:hypothetical protein